MSETNQTFTSSPDPSPRAFKKKLLRARELHGQARVNHHEMVGLLVEVFEDPDFRGDPSYFPNEWDQDTAWGHLDEYVQDLQFGFRDLMGIYKRFPNAADWQENLLVRMFEVVVKENSKPDRTEPPRPQRRIKAADYDDLERHYQALQRREKSKQAVHNELKQDYQRAADRIHELEEKLNAARARIRELEEDLALARQRMGKSDAVAA